MVKFTEYLQKFFDIPEKHKGKIIEGFDPKAVTYEILEKRITQIFQVIDTYTENPTTKFSDVLGGLLFESLGDVVYELSEGLTNGISDFREIFRETLTATVQQSFGQTESTLVQPIYQLSWSKIEAAWKQKFGQMRQQQQKVQEV